MLDITTRLWYNIDSQKKNTKQTKKIKKCLTNQSIYDRINTVKRDWISRLEKTTPKKLLDKMVITWYNKYIKTTKDN